MNYFNNNTGLFVDNNLQAPARTNHCKCVGTPHILLPIYPFIPGVINPLINMNRNNPCITQFEVNYRNNMRSLWEEHVAWTRMAIISLVFDLPDINEVLARLLKNADDMGDMIRILYGDDVATTYSQLIQDHLLIAADLVKASLAGDMQAAQDSKEKWYDNADEIARFLNRVNPFIDEDSFREMFYHHLDLTKQEATFMINNEFEKDIAIYDEIEKQARLMADTISDAMAQHYSHLF